MSNVKKGPKTFADIPGIRESLNPCERTMKEVTNVFKVLWVNYFDRRCQYCGRFTKFNDLTLEHIVPRCYGGSEKPSNLTIVCNICNNKKSEEDGKLALSVTTPKNSLNLYHDIIAFGIKEVFEGITETTCPENTLKLYKEFTYNSYKVFFWKNPNTGLISQIWIDNGIDETLIFKPKKLIKLFREAGYIID